MNRQSFNHEEYISKHIPYRMQAIDWLNCVVWYISKWQEAKPMVISIDGKEIIRGNHYALTNPSLEIGLIYCRVLLEFLGLRADKTKNRLENWSRKPPDTITIEDFKFEGEPLNKITREDVLSTYPGPLKDAEKALVTVIAHADKAVAHLTTGPSTDPEVLTRYEIASRGVPKIVCQFFYNRLKLPHPDYEIKHTLRNNCQKGVKRRI